MEEWKMGKLCRQKEKVCKGSEAGENLMDYRE